MSSESFRTAGEGGTRWLSPKRVAWAITVFASGSLAGVIARPYLGELWRSVRNDRGSFDPRSPSLYAAKAGQFRLLDPHVEPGVLVYLGDSVTAWIDVPEFLAALERPVLNRAIAGDTTVSMLRRLERSFPRGAEVCFLLVGFNDLALGASAAETAGRVEKICRVLLDEHEAKHVVLESVLPAAGPRSLNDEIVKLNRLLRDVAGELPAVSFLDIHPYYLSDGEQARDFYVDRVHLNARGVQLRLERERHHLRQVRPEVEFRLAGTTGG